MKVLETNVLHASDVIFWLDGTTGSDGSPGQMQRLDRELTVAFENLPADVSVLHKPGRTALWRRPTEAMVAGLATEAQRARPAAPTYSVAGTAREPSERYNPRTFSLTIGDGSGHTVVMYPTALGTRFGSAGGLQGTVRRAADHLPVPWALLQLVVTTSLTSSMTFRAQTDRKGDFLLAMRRLPPLPESVSDYQAQLSIRGNLSADPEQPLDPGALTSVHVGQPGAGGFAQDIQLNVVPGEIRLMRSFSRDYLAVQSA